MKMPRKFRLLIGLIAAGGAALIVVWLEGRNWARVVEIRQRTEAFASGRFHSAARLEVRVRRLNSLFFRFSLGLLPAVQPEIRTEVGALREWIEAQRRGTKTAREEEVFNRVQILVRQYLEHSMPILESTYLPSQAEEWRRIKESYFARIIAACGELREAEEDAAEAFLDANQQDIQTLERGLIISSFVLVGVGALLAALGYALVIAPLRRNLQRSRTVIQRQEKLTALGMVAAGVAHEIRNPLTSIKARLFTQQALLEKGSDAWEDNGFIAGEISRLESIVRSFLAFARPAEPELARVRLAEVAGEVAQLFQSDLHNRGIEVRLVVEQDVRVSADGAQLKQVLINLVKNAAESIRTTGRIVLRVRSTPSSGAKQRPHSAVVEVEDNGSGIPPQVRSRLFDPFFTTKAQGSGLGLSTSLRIIEKHGGTIEFESTAPSGTVFRILLPALPDHETQTNSPD